MKIVPDKSDYNIRKHAEIWGVSFVVLQALVKSGEYYTVPYTKMEEWLKEQMAMIFNEVELE